MSKQLMYVTGTRQTINGFEVNTSKLWITKEGATFTSLDEALPMMTVRNAYELPYDEDLVIFKWDNYIPAHTPFFVVDRGSVLRHVSDEPLYGTEDFLKYGSCDASIYLIDRSGFLTKIEI